MKPFILAEVKNRVRKVFILTKVEKYVHVGNHWISEISGKALDRAHKAMQVVKRSELEQYLQTGRVGAEHYLQQSKHWVLSTSERALSEAYSAAQILKQIEDDHFMGTEAAVIANYSDSVSTYFHLVSKKYLLIIQVRLLEFRVSRSIGDTSSFSDPSVELHTESSTILDKLKFIDEVIVRYRTQQTNTASPREGAGFTGRRTADMTEQEIRDQLRSHLGNQFNSQLDDQIVKHQNPWKAIGLLQLPFKKEESSFASPPKVTVEPPSQAQPLQPRSQGNLVANAGVASMLVAGGFAAGGMCTWAALSMQNSLTTERKQQSSEGMRSNQTLTTTAQARAIASPSAPERMPLESSRSGEKPTEQIHPESMETSSLEAPAPVRPRAPAPTRSTAMASQTKTAPKTAVINKPQKKLLRLADLQGRSARELTIMRNEIFARHGRRFKEPELQRYFKSQSWYQPRYSPDEFPVALLSKTEIQNAILIRDYQRAHNLE